MTNPPHPEAGAPSLGDKEGPMDCYQYGTIEGGEGKIEALLKQLDLVAKGYAEHIHPDAIGGKPEHYIQGKAAALIRQLVAERNEARLLRGDHALAAQVRPAQASEEEKVARRESNQRLGR